ncbi:MAG: VF530 family protein [Candidatus Eisenbacteria bacterium]|nr:VF530 family protein [Candidatus Eisenbacteria bacterium]
MTKPARARGDGPAPPADQPRNPLHGITLERQLTELVARLGWEELGRRIRIRCFTSDPSVASSLGFLRKTPWAREKVGTLYLRLLRKRERLSRDPPSGLPG